MTKKNKQRRTPFLGCNWRKLLVLAGCLPLAGFIWADPKPEPTKGDLQISLTARKVVKDADGREALEAAERAFPGEVIQYDAVYRNRGEGMVGKVLPTLPIPVGMIYIPRSSHPAPAEASLDGKRFQSIPLKRTVRQADGSIVEVVIPESEYRALRWAAGDIEAGASVAVVARVQIAPTAR